MSRSLRPALSRSRRPALSRSRRPARLPHALTLAAAALVVSACAGGDAEAQRIDVPDGALEVVGTDRLEFVPETLEATAGEITFALTCEGGVNHNLVIDETDEVVAECRRGQTGLGTVELEPGSYTYVCTIPGHERTMRGTLTVD
jgi:plastocyanin